MITFNSLTNGTDTPRSQEPTGSALKKQSAPIAILGVPFDRVSISETIEIIEEMIESRRPHYLVTPNVDFLVQASKDLELRRILFEAHLVLCDGTPLLWASRLLGNPLPERVAGSDLVPLLIRVAAEKGYRIFFLGGDSATTERAIGKLIAQYPGLIVAGHYCPRFVPLLEMDHSEMARRITAARPDILFVSFGCPKQEKWIAMHYRSLEVPVAVGVGGTIDFLAGRLARAPLWMRRTGTEWIFRLAQEPRRLFWRYLKDMWHFIGPVCAQWWRLQFRRRARSISGPNMPSSFEPDGPFVPLPERFDADAVRQGLFAWEALLAKHRSCFFDLAPVRFIDSTGVGALIHLQKRARISSRQLYFIAPSEPVRRALSQMQLDSFFDFATDLEMARMQASRSQPLAPAIVKSQSAAGGKSLQWREEITAANADQVWEITERFIRCQAIWQPRLAIELDQLRFIDSTGLDLLLRAKKLAARAGVELVLCHPSQAVRNVARMAALEKYLFEQAR